MIVSRTILVMARRGGGGLRYFSAAAREELGSIPLSYPAVIVWGSNTGVGKTLFSAGLAAAARRAGLPLLYLKPAQTGFPGDSDARLVGAAAGLPLAAGPHAAQLDASIPLASGPGGGSSPGSALAKTLYAWRQPISPHLAVETEGRPVSDRRLAADVAAELRAFAAAADSCGSSSDSRSSGSSFPTVPQLAVVETAGGVASPSPSGALQCEALRALSLPGLLVGDGRLGGISATLAAYDALVLRGHAVPLVALMEDGRLDNAKAIQRHLGSKARVLAFPMCPPPPEAAPPAAGGIDASLAAWLRDSRPQFDALLCATCDAHAARLAGLHAAADEARATLWWPFTQHASVAGVTVIDGRVGESFAVFRPGGAAPQGGQAGSSGKPAGQASAPPACEGSGRADGTSGTSEGARLELQYDSCASWWTQGVSQGAQAELVRAVAAAAARYGHVMFPENTHAPALELAKQLLGGVGAGWASRVFYTDNGSTGVEVALKMAFRRFMADHGLLDAHGVELEVLGLTEGYHGDTLGAMEAVAPSPFNGRLQTPWYRGRGLFLEPPTAAVQDGAWRVQLPASFPTPDASSDSLTFGGEAEVFDVAARMGGPLYRLYRAQIEQELEAHSAPAAGQAPRRLGALILEPVLQGAGGMRLVDPLYQRALVEACRERRIPVIYDEVFTGCWRLGVQAGAALLGAPPDIAVYAKLLTGGLVPLAATLASQAVFDAFQGDTKAQALLHGHSYTAHPIGCGAGVAALQLYRDPALNPNWCTPEATGRCSRERRGGERCSGPCGRLLPLWDTARVAELSAHRSVQSVVPLGTVLAVKLQAEDGSGYGSNAAAAVVARLRSQGVYGRPLGDVAYLMVTPMTEQAQCDVLLDRLAAALDG